jgi:hypothetical protein
MTDGRMDGWTDEHRQANPHRVSLNGSWAFHLAPSPERVPVGFQAPAFDDSRWGSLTVRASPDAPPLMRCLHTAMNKLRIVTLGFGTARQRMALER